MAASALAQRAEGFPRPPRRSVLAAVALAGCAAAVGVVVITLGIDEPAPGVDAGIVSWIVLAYVVCGLVAWSRRPESRFGRLMVRLGSAPCSRGSRSSTRAGD
jgi:peptidoglycan/LPS O-acetylase OafA/YrhL